MSDKYRSKEILQDAKAESSDRDMPAFLARPEGAPVYHGFPVVEETRSDDGWVMGAITSFDGPEDSTYGDGFVVAPDGSRAGLVWEVGEGSFHEVLPPDEERWGVYAVWFPRPVRNAQDLAANFNAVLPALRARHQELRSNSR